MDYVDGTDAGRLIRERYAGGMPEQDVSEIVTAIADALDFGHEHRLLHRDVKPENILVTADESHRRRVLLTDFGIARRIDDVSNLTDDNVAVGTISYVAPEQLLGKPLDGRADQYALAATTFHLLAGTPPFQDPNRAVVISHHLRTPPPRLSDRRPDLAHLDAVLAKALAKDPNERYPNCLDFCPGARTAGANRAPPRRNPACNRRPPSASVQATVHRTQRLERLVVHGTARGVRQSTVGAQDRSASCRSNWCQHDRRAPVPVEMQTQLVAGQLADGDEVEVSGVWDGRSLDADTVVNLSAGVPERRWSKVRANRRARRPKSPREEPPKGRRGRKVRSSRSPV